MDRYNPVTDFVVTFRGACRRRLYRTPGNRRRIKLVKLWLSVLLFTAGFATLFVALLN